MEFDNDVLSQAKLPEVETSVGRPDCWGGGQRPTIRRRRDLERIESNSDESRAVNQRRFCFANGRSQLETLRVL